jgi:hypothetical protein
MEKTGARSEKKGYPCFMIMGIPRRGHRIRIATARTIIKIMLIGIPCLKNSPAVNCLDS